MVGLDPAYKAVLHSASGDWSGKAALRRRAAARMSAMGRERSRLGGIKKGAAATAPSSDGQNDLVINRPTSEALP